MRFDRIEQRVVVVELKFTVPIEVPKDWDSGMVDFWMNGSSSCADNLVDHLASMVAENDEGPGCFCGRMRGRYLREATEEEAALLPKEEDPK